MTHHYDLLLLLNGMFRLALWVGATLFAFYRKRAFCVVGFALGLLITGARGFTDAIVPVSDLIALLSFLSTPCAGFIIASFVAAQPRHAGRPARWAP